MKNHAITEPKPGELGRGCKCGERFPTLKAAEGHVADRNLIEENEAKAAAAKAAEIEQQARVASEPMSVDAVATPPADESPLPVKDAPPAANTPSAVVAAPAAPEPEQPQPPAPVPVADPPQALSPSNLPLDLENLSLNQINFIGRTMAESRMFPDVTDAAKALVKILAGKEIGITPFQAMTNINIIAGKAAMGANLMAAKVKGSGKYDYRVAKMDATECSIDFYEFIHGKRELIGKSAFTLEDAQKAGTKNLDKFPRNMLFARAMSNGVRWYTPDVFNGNLVYVPEELGAEVNEDGEIVGRAA